MFLVSAMLYTSPGIAAVMIIFRMAHPVAVIYILLSLFGNLEWTKRAISDSDKWIDLVNLDFAKTNIPATGAITVLSFCDVTLVQMMPWKSVDFYVESKGFPSMSMMRFCLGIETIQSIVSVICQIIYLLAYNDVNDPLMSVQARLLFGLNIFSSVMTVIISVVMLFFKQVLLKQERRKSTIVELQNVYINSTDILQTGLIDTSQAGVNYSGTAKCIQRQSGFHPNAGESFIRPGRSKCWRAKGSRRRKYCS